MDAGAIKPVLGGSDVLAPGLLTEGANLQDVPNYYITVIKRIGCCHLWSRERTCNGSRIDGLRKRRNKERTKRTRYHITPSFRRCSVVI